MFLDTSLYFHLKLSEFFKQMRQFSFISSWTYSNFRATVSAIVEDPQEHFDGKSNSKDEHDTKGDKESDFEAVSEVNQDGSDDNVPKDQLCHI